MYSVLDVMIPAWTVSPSAKAIRARGQAHSQFDESSTPQQDTLKKTSTSVDNETANTNNHSNHSTAKKKKIRIKYNYQNNND